MASEVRTRGPGAPAARWTRPPPPSLDELRRLLFGAEQNRLGEIERRLERPTVTTEAVGAVLADAVVEARKDGRRLTWALAPVVIDAFRDATAKNPELVTDVVAPLLGPSIRAAVARAMDSLVERFEAAFERTLTVEGLGWRLEALRTGRPLGEVVLVHTTIYRVEQVFLIRRDSALVLQHLIANDIPEQDPDQVAAMLSAIDSFVHEALREPARLERFTAGELTLFVVHGPTALIVAVLRGTAPVSYQEQLEQTLQRIQLEFRDELRSGETDPRVFERSQPALCELLRAEHRPRKATYGRRARTVLVAALLAASLALAVVLGTRQRAARLDAARFDAGLAALRNEPGLVVTSSARSRGLYRYEGLEDPLATPPSRVLASRGITEGHAILSFAPFLSLDARLLPRRVERALEPPPGVVLRVEGRTARAEGIAPRAWLDGARMRAATVPGLEHFDASGVLERETSERVAALRAGIERATVGFAPRRSEPEASDAATLDAVALDARGLATEAPRMGLSARIVVAGHADPRGSPARNEALGDARARRVVDALRARSVPDAMLRAEDVRQPVLPGSCTPAAGARCAEEHSLARRATFRVELVPGAS